MFRMNINLGSKETWAKIGEGSWRLGKTIVKKGVQAMVVETAGKATMAALEGDMSKVKQQLTFDEIVGPKKVKSDKPKKKLFGKKKDAAEELAEEITEETVEKTLEKAKELIDGK
jgi:hypothetical protein